MPSKTKKYVGTKPGKDEPAILLNPYTAPPVKRDEVDTTNSSEIYGYTKNITSGDNKGTN